MTKTCQNPECGKPLTRNQRERQKDWDKRLACNKACYKAYRRAQTAIIMEQRRECEVCGKELTPTFDSRGRLKAPRTCRTKVCLAESKRRTSAAKMAAQGGPDASARTWKDPAGNVHTLPNNIALREEYKASVRRRIKNGEGVQMIGNVRVYEGPMTRAAA